MGGGWSEIAGAYRACSADAWASRQATHDGARDKRLESTLSRRRLTSLPFLPSSVYLGFFLPGKLASNLFDRRPDLGEWCGGKRETARERRAARRERDATGAEPFQPPLFLCFTVNDLQGRTFAVWTLTTCALCLVCARDPRVKPVYGE